jgi:hypothetical protein
VERIRRPAPRRKFGSPTSILTVSEGALSWLKQPNQLVHSRQTSIRKKTITIPPARSTESHAFSRQSALAIEREVLNWICASMASECANP